MAVVIVEFDELLLVRLAMQHAASMAGLLLTTEATICELLDDKKEKMPAAY